MTATEADMPAAPAADESGRLAVLRARLVSPLPDDRPWGWLGPLLVTAFGAFLRFNRLRVPRALIFDETYYVKDAWSILNHGVELTLVPNANAVIEAGHTHIFAACGGTARALRVAQIRRDRDWNLPDAALHRRTAEQSATASPGDGSVVVVGGGTDGSRDDARCQHAARVVVHRVYMI